jgi:hypothetical protein
MKPKEYDVVRLLRPLQERNLPAGSTGTVVIDYTRFTDKSLPSAYEVEFADSHGITVAFATLSEDDIEVVWRPSTGSDRLPMTPASTVNLDEFLSQAADYGPCVGVHAATPMPLVPPAGVELRR